VALWTIAVAWSLPSGAGGAVLQLYPGSGFQTAAQALRAGDTLVVHQGTYADYGRISVSVQGSAASPVLVMAAPGESAPLITRPSDSAAQNTINIEGATYLTLRGLEITGNGDGINLNINPHHVTVEDCHIHHVDVGINFRSSMHHLTIRRNHIHDTGIGGYTGEGMYVGCNYATCAVSESIFEGNWIHNTLAASQGDGIEIKAGSWGNVIRDNVIYDTNYPCILLYGTSGNARNVVERNVMWNCGDSGIQAAADAVIRNNLILDSPGNGFNSQDHQGVTPNNLEFTHNTVIGGNPCLRLANWGGKQGMALANNAIYCPSNTYSIGSLTGVAITGNVVSPGTTALPVGGVVIGGSIVLDFVNAAARNYYPTTNSKVVDAGSAPYGAAEDFNSTTRTGAPDAGAYTWTQNANPGWAVVPGFKQIGSGGGGDAAPPAEVNDLRMAP